MRRRRGPRGGVRTAGPGSRRPPPVGDVPGAQSSARRSTRIARVYRAALRDPDFRPLLRATVAAANQAFPRVRAGQVAEWQTRTVQVRVPETVWGFNSPLAHITKPR